MATIVVLVSYSTGALKPQFLYITVECAAFLGAFSCKEVGVSYRRERFAYTYSSVLQ